MFKYWSAANPLPKHRILETGRIAVSIGKDGDNPTLHLLWNPPLLIFTLYSSDVVLNPIRFVARSLCMASSRPKVWEPGCGSNQLETILTNRFFQVVMNCSFQFWEKELVVSETFKLLNDQPVYWQNMFPQAKRKRHSWPTSFHHRGADPFYWMRVILASNRGTLMEWLGVSHTVKIIKIPVIPFNLF